MNPRLALVALGAAVVGLVVYAATLVGERRGGPDAAAGSADAKPAARGRDDDDPRRPLEHDPERAADREALALALRTRLERALEAPEDEEPPLPPSQSRVEAETAFDVVMEQLERYADQDAPISGRRKARMYRAANDAFSALSNQLDPKNQRDMQALEDAHVRMRAMFVELDIAPPRPPRTP